MQSAGWGPDSVESILRHRGHMILGVGEIRDLLLPLDRQPPISGEDITRFLEHFGKRSFRQIARQLLISKDGSVRVTDLEGYAGEDARGYLEFLVALGVGDLTDDIFVTRRPLNNIGPTLEWYVAELCRRELAGSAAWSVKLEGLPAGGDYDILAWLPPSMVWIEAKSAAPSQITDSELRHFLQRGEELQRLASKVIVSSN